MKAFPSNLVFKKYHKKNKNFLTYNEKKIFFPTAGNFALQSMESGKMTYKQIEACRRALRRSFGKLVKLWIRLFTYQQVTAKSSASRMGKGKGNLAYWIAPIKRGQILFEVYSDSLEKAYLYLTKASTKLPLKVKIIGLRY